VNEKKDGKRIKISSKWISNANGAVLIQRKDMPDNRRRGRM
jgi:hypothetical protein